MPGAWLGRIAMIVMAIVLVLGLLVSAFATPVVY